MVKKNYKGRTNKQLGKIQSATFLYQPLIDLATDEDLAEAFCNVVRRLLTSPDMESVRRGFEESKLDPHSPHGWAALLKSFADVHYTRGSPGRLSHRSGEYWEQFAHDLQMLREKYPEAEETVSELFLKDSVSKRDVYKSLKKEGGVRSAVNELKKRLSRENPASPKKTKPSKRDG